MSRIGRMPIAIPAGVEVTVANGVVTVKGPKGQLCQDYSKEIECKLENGQLIVTRINEDKETKAKHGMYRALFHNMVVGVTQGYQKVLSINGVGYKAQMQGNKLVMNLGLSHNIEFVAPEGVTLECPSVTEVVVKGIDKNLVGQVAANIRAKREVEPYHGYGIRYKDEVVVIKEGKTAGK
mgnify:CR=1 FL=1